MDFSARFDSWFEKLPPSPTDNGRVIQCVVRPAKGARELPEEITLTPENGIEGDRWSHAKDPNREVQVSLINIHVVRSCADSDDPQRTALSGDNLQVDLNLTEENLPAGTFLRIGTARLRVSEEPHRPCATFSKHFGPKAAKRVARAVRIGRRGRGVVCHVVQSGRIRVGDEILVERTEAVSSSLESSVADAPLPDLQTSVDLAIRATEGDEIALNDLMRRYQSRLRRIVRIRMSARARQKFESMDIVQDTYEVVARKIGDFEVRNHPAILRWLAKIAENKIRERMDRLKAGIRDMDLEVALDDLMGPDQEGNFDVPADETRPEDRVMKRELRAIMDEVVTGMKDEWREVIVLHWYNELDFEEIARTLEPERTAAAWREMFARARTRLYLEVGRRLRGGEPGRDAADDGAANQE